MEALLKAEECMQLLTEIIGQLQETAVSFKGGVSGEIRESYLKANASALERCAKLQNSLTMIIQEEQAKMLS